MRRLVWAFAVRICPKTCFPIALPNYSMIHQNRIISLIYPRHTPYSLTFDLYGISGCFYIRTGTTGCWYDKIKRYLVGIFKRAIQRSTRDTFSSSKPQHELLLWLTIWYLASSNIFGEGGWKEGVWSFKQDGNHAHIRWAIVVTFHPCYLASVTFSRFENQNGQHLLWSRSAILEKEGGSFN